MLLKALDAVGGLMHFVQPGDVVLIKPNVAFDRSPNLGATTNPLIIANVANNDPDLRQKLEDFRSRQRDTVLDMTLPPAE